MADTQSDYHHGQMNAATQVADYKVFLNFTKWAALFLAALILMLTLWFCVGSGFFGGAIPGVIVLALGIYFMRARPAQLH